MAKEVAGLQKSASNINSQLGEDGIIEKILNTLQAKDGWCVEFGAWDGKYMSNTRNLIDNKGYSAVLIEGNKTKSDLLKTSFDNNPKVTVINQFVGFGQEDNLDKILESTSIPKNFDFLSIDIDGNDYHVWNAVKEYAPKVVCIEFNQTIPNNVDFVQDADPDVNQGSSLLAITKLASEKGYKLVAVTRFNAFFVKTEYFELFKIGSNDINVLHSDDSNVTYMFVGYDGKVILRGYKKLPWHNNIDIKENSVQTLPRFLRKFPGNYNGAEKILYGILLLILKPRALKDAVSSILQRKGLPF